MKFATVSLNQVWRDKSKNIDLCKYYVKKAAEKRVDIIIFPEMTLTGFSMNTISLSEEVSNSETLENFSKLSKKYGVNIIFGACLIMDQDKLPKNTLCVAYKNGLVESVYSKIHLFSHAGEGERTLPGDKISVRKIENINFGFSICYDLRFPEIFSLMSSECNVVITIANWPAIRSADWILLLRARALENGCFMIGVNRSGMDGNSLKYNGDSLVVSPDGNEMNCYYFESDMRLYNIDNHEIVDNQKTISTLKDKRYELYSNMYKQKL